MTRGLWTCPQCGNTFTTPNQWHSCGQFDLEAHFESVDEEVELRYQRFAGMVRSCGPVRIIPQKTRIAFQVRTRFAILTPYKSHVIGGLILDEPIKSDRFTKVESCGPHAHEHTFRLGKLEELDDEFMGWIRRAYSVGTQRSLEEDKGA
ncbi:MAG: DUF5655 domain-containing protein [Gemmatimonadota bacterium]